MANNKINTLKLSNKFTKDERTHLLKLTEKYSDIINDRRASTNIVLEKRQTWSAIASEYNRTQNFRPRLTKQLKRLWENTKARAKTLRGSDEIKHVTMKNEQLSDASIDIEGNNDSICSDSPSITESYDNIEDDRHATTNDSLEFEQIFVTDADKRKLKQSKDSLSKNSHSNRNFSENVEPNDNTMPKTSDDRTEVGYDELLTPIIAGRVKNLESNLEQQKELHKLAVQREQLQVEILKQQLKNQTEAHIKQMEKEHELHELRIKHEREIQAQRIRHEEDLHQLKLAEYNKVTAYSMGYK